jgi:arylsulfatase A-like enzyme
LTVTNLKRRDFLNALGLGAVALSLRPGKVHAADAVGKPNIVYILADDFGYGDAACYNKDAKIPTPNIDRLAAEGVRFTDAHSASAICSPTRYGILTGRYAWRTRLKRNVLGPYDPPLIEPGRLTVGALLQQHGYHTACIGKWHLGMDWGGAKSEADAKAGTPVADGPTTRGFDEFYGYTEARSIRTVIENDRVVGTFEPVEVQPMMAKRAVAYIDARAKDGKPFFLYQPLSIPHTPHVPAKEFEGKSGQGDYGDWIYEGDWVVSQIVEALQRNGLAENTLLLVSSDNGAEGREYSPLRGSKRSIYEGGHREPLVAWWPGKIKPGTVCDDTVCLNDLLATAAEIVGQKVPDGAGEDSVSLLPLLLGTAKEPVREATVHQSMAGDLAIRQGPWKLIFFKNGKRELYNLKDDLGETKNVAAENADVVERLTKLMQQYIDNGRSTPGAPQKNAVQISIAAPAGDAAAPEGGQGGRRGKKAKS